MVGYSLLYSRPHKSWRERGGSSVYSGNHRGVRGNLRGRARRHRRKTGAGEPIGSNKRRG